MRPQEIQPIISISFPEKILWIKEDIKNEQKKEAQKYKNNYAKPISHKMYNTAVCIVILAVCLVISSLQQ